MAAITLPSKGRGYQLVLDLSLNSQSIANNQSVVNWNLYILKGSGSGAYTSYTVYWSGPGASGSRPGFDFRGYTSLGLGSGTFIVNHNADGTGVANTSGAFSETDSDPELGNGTVYASLALPTIPRATQPTVSPTSGDTGATYTITHTPATSSFYHDVAYSLDGGATYTDIQTDIVGTDTSTDWTPAHSLLPNATSVTAIIRVITRQTAGGTIIGTRTVNLPLTVPASVKPTVSAVSWTDAQTSSPDVPTLMGGAGRFVQGWSKLLPTVTSAGAGGSSIVSASVTQGGQVTASGTAFTAPVNLSGAVPFSATARDSRGVNSDAYANTVAVTAYNFPSLPTPEITRTSDAAGLIPSPVGTYFAITPLASVSSLIFASVQKNLLEWRIRVKQVGGSYVTVQDWNSATVSGNTWTTKQVIGGSYLASNEYIVEVSIRDLFGKNGFNAGSTVKSLEILVPSERVEMDWDGTNGLGLGGYRRDPFKLDVHGLIGQDGERVVDVSDLATTAARGIVELATSAEVSALTATDLAVTPAGLAALVARLLDASRNRNRIDNGNFRTNQRAYVSGSTMTPESYCFDRWRALGNINRIPNPTGAWTTERYRGWTTDSGASGTISGQAGTVPGVSHQNSFLRSTPANGSTGGIYYNGNTAALAAPATAYMPQIRYSGGPYLLTIWVRASVAKTVTLAREDFSPSGGTLGVANSGSNVALVANVWTKLSWVFTPALATRQITFRVNLATGTWNGSQSLDVAAACLVEGATDVGYFDGASTPGMWTGVVNVSPSYNVSSLQSLAFTSAPQGQSVTISSGGGLRQIIERGEITAGDYVLSWSGTATGRIHNVGGAVPALAVSPVLVTLDGLADVIVDFVAVGGTKSLGNVQLELGTLPSPFETIPYAEEVAICQRHFRVFAPDEAIAINRYRAIGLGAGGVDGDLLSPPMRISPALTVAAGSPYPDALPFTFFNESAGSSIARNLAASWNNRAGRVTYQYDSGSNGGALLPAGYLAGRNQVALWVSSDM